MIKIIHLFISLMIVLASRTCGIDMERFYPRDVEQGSDEAPVQQLPVEDKYTEWEKITVGNEDLFETIRKDMQKTQDWPDDTEGKVGYFPGLGKTWSGTAWDESPFLRENVERAYEALDLEDEYALSDLLDAAEHPDVNVRERAIGVLGLIGPVDDRILPAIAKGLSDPDEHVRSASARALARIGEEGLPYVYNALESDRTVVIEAAIQSLRRYARDSGNDIDLKVFTDALRHPDSKIRFAGEKALTEIGNRAIECLPDICKILEDEYSWNRYSAAKVIASFGKDASPALPMLIRYVYDYHYDMRDIVGQAIRNIEEDAYNVIKELNVEMGLGDIFGPKFEKMYITGLELNSDDDVKTLVAALKSDSRVKRWLAAEVLRRCAPYAAGAVPGLIDALDDDDEWLRIFAIDALGAIGSDATDAPPALRNIAGDATVQNHARVAAARIEGFERLRPLLGDENEWVRINAADAIAAIGEDAIDAASDLVTLLDDESVLVRNAASRALASIGYYDPRAIEYFVNIIRDGQYWEVYNAAQALEKFGPDAVPPLVDILKNSGDHPREHAARALGLMGKNAVPAIPALIDAMNNEAQYVGSKAITSLGQICARPDLSVPALISAMASENMSFKYNAAQALKCFGPDAIEALPALKIALDDYYGRIRVDSAMAIYRIAPDAIDIVPFLINELEDLSIEAYPGVTKDDPEAGRNSSPTSAARALGELGKVAIDAIPHLIEMLDRETHYHRWAACDGLAGIGPAASDALPKLKDLSENDPDPTVREAAVEAIVLIGM